MTVPGRVGSQRPIESPKLRTDAPVSKKIAAQSICPIPASGATTGAGCAESLG